MAGHHNPDDYYETLRRRYGEFREEARRREADGQGEYWPVIRYYTPAGEIIRVAHVMRNPGSNILEIQGDDGAGNPCDVITSTASAQIVIKLLAPASEPERRPVGFGPRD